MKTILLVLLGLLVMFGFFHMKNSNTSKPQFLLKSPQNSPKNVISQFNQWKNSFGVQYRSVDDEAMRLVVFTENLDYIEKQNSMGHSYKLGSNQFMDLTNEEFINTYLGKLNGLHQIDHEKDEEYKVPNSYFNWADKGAVTGVKNQGSCGSCWAFSTTGNVEGFWFLNKGGLPSLSEQQLVDCSGSYGNYGCNGGWPESALNYVRDHGLVTEGEYPYVARDQNCLINQGPYKISRVQAGSSCGTLVNDINSQPTSVCVDASNWQFYSSGVFSNCNKNINHAVLATGYDDAGNWIVKNSWGYGWGQNGYIYLANGDTCGVCEYLANSY